MTIGSGRGGGCGPARWRGHPDLCQPRTHGRCSGRHKNGPGPTQIRPACLGTPGLRSGLIALLAGPYRPVSVGRLPPPLGGGPAEWCAPLPADPSTYGAVSSLGRGRVRVVQTEPQVGCKKRTAKHMPVRAWNRQILIGRLAEPLEVWAGRTSSAPAL